MSSDRELDAAGHGERLLSSLVAAHPSVRIARDAAVTGRVTHAGRSRGCRAGRFGGRAEGGEGAGG